MTEIAGPEKPLDGSWAKLVAQSIAPDTASKQALGVRRVRPRHRMVAMLAEAGWKNTDIAKALGYTIGRVSIILNSQNPTLKEVRTKFAAQVADNVQDIHVRLRLYANEMLDRMVVHARQNDKPELSRLAARDLLNMAGFTPVKKQFIMESKVPFEELARVAATINEANEVVLKKAEWEVREVRKSA